MVMGVMMMMMKLRLMLKTGDCGGVAASIRRSWHLRHGPRHAANLASAVAKHEQVQLFDLVLLRGDRGSKGVVLGEFRRERLGLGLDPTHQPRVDRCLLGEAQLLSLQVGGNARCNAGRGVGWKGATGVAEAAAKSCARTRNQHLLAVLAVGVELAGAVSAVAVDAFHVTLRT